MVEENYMEMKILLPFWLFLVRLHCCLVDAAERTTENNELWLAENEVWIRMRIGTTSNIKITRDEAISAHELNEICAFLLLTTFLRYSLSLNPNINRDCSRRHVNFYHLLPWEHQLILMSWNVDLATSGNFIGNVIFITEIIITPNAME